MFLVQVVQSDIWSSLRDIDEAPKVGKFCEEEPGMERTPGGEVVPNEVEDEESDEEQGEVLVEELYEGENDGEG